MLPSLRSRKLFSLLTLLGLVAPTLARPNTHPVDLQTREEEKKEPEKPKTPKYFHEPGGSLARIHYDTRFFQDEISYDDHRAVLRDLIRSYLSVLGEHGAETWLAHGTLLGWWWNGQIMPWDYDLDVQVSNHTLSWMGENLNNTEHTYKTTAFEDGTPVEIEKKYLMDINPHHSEIDRGDGMNIIDARWIDMQNGMFVDITGVREREADRPGIWSCKNHHRYESQDLWPMRTTEFEGVKARIPYSFQRILSDEYGDKSLVAEEWQNHRWNHEIKEWVMMSKDEEQAAKKEAITRKLEEIKAQKYA